MLQIRSLVLFAALGGLPSVANLAQTSVGLTGTSSVNADERVLNAPYSAQRHFTSVEKSADGKISRSESGGSEARDSQGRTYTAGERHWTYQAGGKSVLKSEMLYRIHDPVANTDTKWDSTSKQAKVIHWTETAGNEDVSNANCQKCLEATKSDFGEVEKLGVKTLGGFVAEGTRSSFPVPTGQNGNDQPIVVVHETWYCPELKIVILEINDDPRSGKSRNELVEIVRGEPDVKKYYPPADYIVHKLQMP
jgi:hypothetical protein